MINAIVGRPRSGKSYEAVLFHIIPSAQYLSPENKGRLVVTNIPINKEAVSKFYNQETADNIIVVQANFTSYGMQRPFSVPEDFTKYDWKNEKNQGPLFVVDEAHLCMGNTAKIEVLEYLSMHGHYGHDIILLTQSHSKLHRDVKQMVEVCWRCIKKSVFGDDTHYIKKTYHGVPQRNEGFVHEEEREYLKQYFQFYQSHTQSSSSVTEATSKDIKANLFPYKKLSIGLILVGILLSGYTIKRVLFGNSVASPQVKEVLPLSLPSNSEVNIPNSNSNFSQSKPRPERHHPFYKVGLHIDSQAEYTSGKYLIREVYFMASQNGQAMFTIKTSDLRLAGYDVGVYGECLVRIQYQEIYDDWLTCDSPRVSLSTPVDNQIASNQSDGS